MLLPITHNQLLIRKSREFGIKLSVYRKEEHGQGYLFEALPVSQ